MAPPVLNFHHLQYFWAVARDGNLTRTAVRLRVAPSALSTQIRQLEEQIGQPLFSREGRRLVLTEAGKIALAYADDIFAAGTELVATLQQGRRRQNALRIGAVATLSRNFQRSFLQPMLAKPHALLQLTSGASMSCWGSSRPTPWTSCSQTALRPAPRSDAFVRSAWRGNT